MASEPRAEVKDDYDHNDDQIEYVIESVLFELKPHNHPSPEYEALTEQFNSILLNPCSCETSCDNNTTHRCPHGGNYILASSELVLNPSRPSKDLLYECSTTCKCDPTICQNRLVQYGPRSNLEIIASKVLHKQYALQTSEPIPRGAFICEYAGEILTRSEAQHRMEPEPGGGSNKMNYVLCLNEYSLDGSSTSSAPSHQTFIDPRLRGNIGRYLNHSCQPNCEIFSVRVDCPIPKIAIFAKQDIAPGEELSFHYGGGTKSYKHDADANNLRVTRCLCGCSNCEKFLPNLEF